MFDKYIRIPGLYIGRENENFVIELFGLIVYRKKDVFLLDAFFAWKHDDFILEKCLKKYGKRDLKSLIEIKISQTRKDIECSKDDIKYYKKIIKDICQNQ